jgi:ADP-ribose pyrophosphatase
MSNVLHTRTVYDGRIFSVTVDRVRLPHGREADLEVVRHRGSVVLIPEPEPGRVILVRQYRHAVGRALWELPAGGIDAGETSDAAARRECREEVGFVPARVELRARMFPTPGFCTEEMFFYRCTGLTPHHGPTHHDEDEHLDVRTFDLADLKEQVKRGEIADLKTAAALLLS